MIKNKIKYIFVDLCECGCGEMTKNRFVHGHNKGHTTLHSEETKKKIREKRYLQKFSEESIKRRNESIRLKWQEPGFREKMKKVQTGRHYILPEQSKKNMGRYKRTDVWKKRQSERWKGSNCNFWQGGISFESYGVEFNNVLKEKIRDRDGYICQICLFSEEELKRKLNIHHIDYNKKNNQEDNLISLCRNCHAKTNHKREQWQLVFAIQ